jgi:hypothetical protein
MPDKPKRIARFLTSASFLFGMKCRPALIAIVGNVRALAAAIATLFHGQLADFKFLEPVGLTAKLSSG